MNNRWNQWVLNYSRGQQFDVLRNMGFASPAWEDLAMLLIGALSSLALAGAAWAWWDRRRVDPWMRQMAQLRRTLATLGVAAGARAAAPLAARLRGALGARGAARRPARAARTAALRPPGATQPDASLTRRFRAEARRLRAAAPG